ncbi:hypothetical protein MTF65_04050 [Streptomyces sp. APSN-46.1]|uniref:hypothetical protein n=1 Tax=Streptomyces sp. APSN-46.1 TaxID=2929049 RepID=UPI001FB46B4A|nr:hypothetical protein [Streptomyces sp. APSN-46.1]MCJ1676533.1 hypothetical protein [Streptomyces sp. APSN-46.1]
MRHDTGVDVERLPAMSRQALDQLFHISPAGEIPVGETRGTVLLGRGARVSKAAAGLVRLLAWKGKVFDADRGELRNRLTPFGVPAIRAKVYRGPSWFDDKECTVLDYSRTSVLAHRIRDEIREIAPGVHLGIVYWGQRKILNFVLRAPGSAGPPGPSGPPGRSAKRRTHQIAVTIRAVVPPDHVADVQELLTEANRKGAAGEFIPFAELAGVHFARLVLVPQGTDHAGAEIPASIVYMSEVDAPLDAHLADLARKAGAGLGKVFGHCEGYPAGSVSDRARIAWLRAHRVPSSAFYVNTVGRGLHQIRQEERLREAIEEFLDQHGPDLSGRSPADVRTAIQRYVTGREDLAWARSPAPPPDLRWRIRQAAHLVAVPLAALALLPVLVFVLPVWAVLVRWHEWRDVPSRERPGRDHVARLAACEDFAAQNPFTAVGLVKPGRFRLATLTGILFVVDYGVRHLFNRGNLAGVKTIHFARWLFLDDRRRVIFASNYDGSLESYMDDFIDKVAWGLNAVFSNGHGYPRTRWLLRDGAEDELAFKHYLRCRQLPTEVWYSAYDTLTTHNLDTNARIRAGLFAELGPAETQAWLALL